MMHGTRVLKATQNMDQLDEVFPIFQIAGARINLYPPCQERYAKEM